MLNPADDTFRAEIAAQLPENVFRPLEERHLEEPRRIAKGHAGFLVAPGSTEEVALIVKAAAKARVGIVPYSGGTGLVGGQIMPDGPPPLLVSLERMRTIRSVHAEENLLIADAGVILAQLQDTAQKTNRLFPLSLASEGSARIGGLLSANAGGTAVLRYGNARDLCLGLEAVMPDGSILHGLKRLRKDNTGYDLKDLLIGAEGTLGIITGATLRLFPQPAATGAALIAVPSPDAAIGLLNEARNRVGECVSTFELMHRQGFDFWAETMPEERLPFAHMPEWLVLIELGLPQGLGPDSVLQGLFETATESGLATDGLIATSEAQRANFWRLRELLPEGNRRIGAISSHDISVPLALISEFITRAPDAIARIGNFRVNCFGHVGDGNLHWNVFPPKGETRDMHVEKRDEIKSAVHDLVHQLGGSISAEHGVGRFKVDDLERYGDPTKLAYMRVIKNALDPEGIMNPGAVLRAR